MLLIAAFTISQAHAYPKAYLAIHPVDHRVVYASFANIAYDLSSTPSTKETDDVMSVMTRKEVGFPLNKDHRMGL